MNGTKVSGGLGEGGRRGGKAEVDFTEWSVGMRLTVREQKTVRMMETWPHNLSPPFSCLFSNPSSTLFNDRWLSFLFMSKAPTPFKPPKLHVCCLQLWTCTHSYTHYYSINPVTSSVLMFTKTPSFWSYIQIWAHKLTIMPTLSSGSKYGFENKWMDE